MAKDRFSARSATRRRKKYGWILATAAFVCVLAGVAWAAWSSSWLAVKDVRVVGIEHGSPDEIVALANVPPDTPLLQVDTRDVAQRVAQADIVKDVSVRREFPDALVVTIGERQAVGWIQKGSRPWAVDAEGVIYRELRSKPSHVPQLKIKPSDKQAVAAGAMVASELASADPTLLERIKSISAKSQDSVELKLDGGKTVSWGGPEKTEQKAKTLLALLNVKASHYDVSAPERPTTRK